MRAREKGRDLIQPYDKSPYTQRMSKKQRDNNMANWNLQWYERFRDKNRLDHVTYNNVFFIG